MSADRLARVRRAGALALVAVLTACSWFTDFKDQPKYDPWKSADTVAMRANPQNSVPVYGTFAPGYAVSRAALPGTIDSMASIPNPVQADARSLLNGRKYYTINCAVCHGYEGKGDGPVVAKGFPGTACAAGNGEAAILVRAAGVIPNSVRYLCINSSARFLMEKYGFSTRLPAAVLMTFRSWPSVVAQRREAST